MRMRRFRHWVNYLMDSWPTLGSQPSAFGASPAPTPEGTPPSAVAPGARPRSRGLSGRPRRRHPSEERARLVSEVVQLVRRRAMVNQLDVVVQNQVRV